MSVATHISVSICALCTVQHFFRSGSSPANRLYIRRDLDVVDVVRFILIALWACLGLRKFNSYSKHLEGICPRPSYVCSMHTVHCTYTNYADIRGRLIGESLEKMISCNSVRLIPAEKKNEKIAEEVKLSAEC